MSGGVSGGVADAPSLEEDREAGFLTPRELPSLQLVLSQPMACSTIGSWLLGLAANGGTKGSGGSATKMTS